MSEKLEPKANLLIEEDKKTFLFIQSIYDLGFKRFQVVKEPDGQTTTFAREGQTIILREVDGSPSRWMYHGVERNICDYPIITEQILQEL